MQRVQENSYIEWDVKTLTSGDYTVEVDLDNDFYPDYRKTIEKDWIKSCIERGLYFDSSVQGFQAWFRHELETRLLRLPDLGYEDEPNLVKVAVMTVAFNNADIIDLLKKRGSAIVAQNWDEQRKIEDEIVKVKNANIPRLTNPCYIFISFQNEEGAERVKQYNDLVENDRELADIKLWLGRRLEFFRACEPSDIIWENRHFTPWERSKKAIIVWVILILCLIGSFVF